MGKLRILKTGPLSTVQDFGRFGYRRFGIPQSGAMDRQFMIAANCHVGNPESYPLIEFAMVGMDMEVTETTVISVVGADCQVNGIPVDGKYLSLKPADFIKISAPHGVYGYLAICGLLRAKEDFGSVSTYTLAGFGGIEGRALKVGDVLMTEKYDEGKGNSVLPIRNSKSIQIRIMKGPEWGLLKEIPYAKSFKVDASSNRMGIRLEGSLDCDFQEIASSAVVPGTIQLPASKQPIVLMNDCQTTGGYPRIGKVLDEDLGKLAQVKPGQKITLIEA